MQAMQQTFLFLYFFITVKSIVSSVTRLYNIIETALDVKHSSVMLLYVDQDLFYEKLKLFCYHYIV